MHSNKFPIKASIFKLSTGWIFTSRLKVPPGMRNFFLSRTLTEKMRENFYSPEKKLSMTWERARAESLSSSSSSVIGLLLCLLCNRFSSSPPWQMSISCLAIFCCWVRARSNIIIISSQQDGTEAWICYSMMIVCELKWPSPRACWLFLSHFTRRVHIHFFFRWEICIVG